MPMLIQHGHQPTRNQKNRIFSLPKLPEPQASPFGSVNAGGAASGSSGSAVPVIERSTIEEEQEIEIPEAFRLMKNGKYLPRPKVRVLDSDSILLFFPILVSWILTCIQFVSVWFVSTLKPHAA